MRFPSFSASYRPKTRHFGMDAEIQYKDVKAQYPPVLRSNHSPNGKLPSMAWIPASMPE